MRMLGWMSWGAATLALGLAGCGSSAEPIHEMDGARAWANRSSAVGVWSRVHDIVGAGNRRDPFRDPECPAITEEGDTVTVTTDCAANDGEIWTGSATIVHDRASGDQDVTIESFGHSSDPGLIAVLSGTVTIRAQPDGTSAFEVDLVNDAPFEGVTTIDYAGTVEGDWSTPTTWNGTGTIDLEGETVTATTVDEVWDGTVCGGAPASGQTTIEAAEHTIVITYDGAVDCDEDKNAQWSLDGTDMGAIDGITCTVSPGAPPSLALLALGLAALGWLVRRRRR